MSSEVLFVVVLKRVLRNMRVELFGQLLEGPALHNEALLTFVNRWDTERATVYFVCFHSSFASYTLKLMRKKRRLITWALRQSLFQGMMDQTANVPYNHCNEVLDCMSSKLIVIDSRPTLSRCQLASLEISTCANQATTCWWMQLPWSTEKHAQLTVHGMHSDPGHAKGQQELNLWASDSGHVHTGFQACYCLKMAKSGLASVALT